MVERLAHFLTGWVEFEVRGNGPRFFNTAAKAGVEFWGFSRRGERLSARGTPGDYKRLRELARRSGAHPTIVARGGLPFTTARLKRRKGLVVGAAAGTAVYLFLSGFCWGVTVTGAETLTRLQVLEAARQSGLSVGAPLREMDYKAMALSIQNRLEGVTWLSVNNNGCFVEVSLRESLPAPEVVNDREWSNMVAARPGTILSVEAERGRPVVSPGDTVTAGQLLIAGLYEQELDPYSPPPDEWRSPRRKRCWCPPAAAARLPWKSLGSVSPWGWRSSRRGASGCGGPPPLGTPWAGPCPLPGK